jgi:hypothetical protein
LAGVPSSLVVSAGRNALLLNFLCFAGERARRSFTLHPTQTSVAGSDDLGMFIFNLTIMFAIALLHGTCAAVVKTWRPEIRIGQAMGAVGFPSLTLLLGLFFLPGAVLGAFRYAFSGQLSGVGLIYPSIMSIVVGAPLAYLYSVLYDESNFCALWEPLSDEALRIRKRHFPVLHWFALPGQWESTDRQLSFYGRLRFLFWEFRVRRCYFITIDAVALSLEAVVMGVVGSSPGLCAAQLALVVALRLSICAMMYLFKPFHAPGVAFVLIALSGAQFVGAVVYLVFALTNFTNTTKLVTFTFLVIESSLLIVVAVGMIVIFAWIRVTQIAFDRDVAISAAKNYNPSPSDPAQAEPRAPEPPETKTSPTALETEPFMPLLAIPEADEPHVATEPVEQPQTKRGPSVWRIIALEEGLNRQYDPNVDDLL